MPKRLLSHNSFLSQTVQKLKSDKKLPLLFLVFILLSIPFWYLTVPAIILWWFLKKSKFSKRAKTFTTATIVGLFAALVIWFGIAYAKDVEPHISIAEPASNTKVLGQKITIKGTYDPSDRKVWVNGKELPASNGSFEYTFDLKEGENKIDVSAGNFKRAHAYLTVVRELTEEEKAVKATPTPTSKQTTAFTENVSLNAIQTPVPSSTFASTTPTRSGETLKVVKVIDGDTINVDLNGKIETLRLIGIDTPETVDPRKPVQCFGIEASNKAKEVLNGQSVRLEADNTQGERDKYGRLLRYIFLLDGTNFNKMMISEGYAHEYTYQSNPYKYQVEFKQAEGEARENKRGLWADNACTGISTQSTIQNSNTAQPSKPVASGSCKYSCSGADRDCSDFSTQAEAQAFFNCCEFTATYDPMKLDSIGVGDGVVCESLP